MRFNQVLNHVTTSVIPYMNEIILGSMGYQNRIWALQDLTAGNKISPVNLKKGVAEGNESETRILNSYINTSSDSLGAGNFSSC